MKSFTKTTTTLILIIIFLTVCMIGGFIIFAAGWLHTYKVFTGRTAVAEITISEIKQDDLGPYMDVEVRQFDANSALSALFVNDEEQSDDISETQTFKLYGDSVHMGGPTIQFKDGIILLNFKSVYKLGKIYSRYNIDNDLEQNRTPEMQSSYDLNGGIANWKDFSDDFTSDNLMGRFYRLFVRNTEISTPGIYATDRELKYTLYVTNTGFFTWDLQEDEL